MTFLFALLVAFNVNAASVSERAPIKDVESIPVDEAATEDILAEEFDAPASQVVAAKNNLTETENLKESEIPVLVETKKAKEVQAPQPLRKMATSLSIILAVILGAGLFLRRWFVQKKKAIPNSQIRIISQHYLGPRKSLAIVHVAGESLLVGITDQQIGLIKQLSLIDDEVPSDLPRKFDETLDFTEKTQPEPGEAFSMRSLKEVVTSRLKNMREI